jgi:hypothetical protein
MLEPTLVSIPRGATQAFILIKADNPVASVILFEGGDGNLGLTSTPPPKVGAEDFDAPALAMRLRRASKVEIALRSTPV